jgi:DNA polymerase I
MKEYNISYETVNCPHKECRENIVPGTTTWICTRNKGIVSEFVGLIRDIRVNIFKKLAKDRSLSKEKREFFNVVQNTLKVFINAIYGVFGSEEFFLFYLPAAEAVATLGRHAIEVSIREAEKLGLQVIYGDTDSIFIKDPPRKMVDELIKVVGKKLKLQLEIDKIYRYVVLSQRKKNYFGVLSDGTLDVKGLVGKKSSTPEYIKRVFYSILEELRHINTQEDFEEAKKKITQIITNAEERLRKKQVRIEDLALAVTLTKPLKSYTKTTPQHVKAARLIELSTGKKIPPGSVIKYVKTVDQNGVKPVELIRDMREVDSNKYIELLWSTLTQIVDVLEIERVAVSKSKRLDQYFL